jgi:hypothetical protein
LKLEELVIAEAGQHWKGSDFRQVLGPGVYVLLDGDKPLYVGRGNNLLRRLSGLHHKRDVIDACDTIKMFPCISIQASIELEQHLIGKMQPKYNDGIKTHILARQLGYSTPKNARKYLPKQ